MRRDSERHAQQGLSGRCAEQDNHLRLQRLDLGDEPGPASDDFGPARLLVYPALAVLAGELEVLDGIGLIRQLRINARVAERPRKQPPRRADEWQPLDVLAVPGLLAHQHDWRIGVAMPEDGLRGVLVQRATMAANGGSRQRVQAAILG